MAVRWRSLAAVSVVGLLVPVSVHGARQPADTHGVAPNYDIRLSQPRPRAPRRAEVQADVERLRGDLGTDTIVRVGPEGRLRAVWTMRPPGPGARGSGLEATSAPAVSARRFLAGYQRALGLDPDDVESLTPDDSLAHPTDLLTHVTFRQRIAGLQVFGAAVRVHLGRDGQLAALSSNAVSARGWRPSGAGLPASEALRAALQSLRIEATSAGVTTGGPDGPAQTTRFSRGSLRSDPEATLVVFPLHDTLRLAWHVVVEPDGLPQKYDVVVDATSGELLYRRNRVLYAEGTGRVLQADSTLARDPRASDPFPAGSAPSGADDPPLGCPPASNHALRSLSAPFRDAGSVLGGSGRLAGNNGRIDRGLPGVSGALGAPQPDGSWLFDSTLSSPEASETHLFFLLNSLHDFFYDLGFDEAAGNFQENNFGRGGRGGDGLTVVSRADGRNNASFEPMPDGQSPVMSLFLWDGNGCWSEDVDADGAEDLDSALDSDVVIHEFTHGVSTRLNPEFTGPEADAMGEGGSDFFAYSLNNDTMLAEYAAPPFGIRHVNGRTYGTWSCFLDIFCEPHDNGEIWANVLWDLRERFRQDLVDGAEPAGVHAAHLLYLDGLKLSPPAPTMLDLRDAMLQADVVRRPSADPGGSVNACRIWEVFALRGLGTAARDTNDTSSLAVVQNFSTPTACPALPPAATVTLTTADATAYEAGANPATFRVSRTGDTSRPLTVYLEPPAGGAVEGRDYQMLPASVVIPAGATTATVIVIPVDDLLVEANESVIVSLSPGPGYRVVAPATATVTIVSDDVAPDLVVSALTGPAAAGAGATLSLSETTRNAGTDHAVASVTRFYLSADTMADPSDVVLASRSVPPLAIGATSSATVTVTLPADTPTGTLYVLAQADADDALPEISNANNVRGLLVRVGPDLTVTSVTVPSVAAPGLAVAINETVKNSGGGSAGASTTQLYLSSNTALDGADVPLASHVVPALAAGASFTATTSVVIPPATSPGTYYVIARADAGGTVVEVVETNNTNVALFRIGGDLVISTLTAPAVSGAGAAIPIADTTRNQGGASTLPSLTRFYLSSDTVVGSADVLLGSRTVGSLGAGASSAGTTTVTLPADTPVGTYYVVAQADADGANEETIETNNATRVQVRVGPDLDVTSLVAPSVAEAGLTITVTDTVKNAGGGTAPTSTVRFYLSANATLDAADQSLGSRLLPTLAAGASHAAATDLTLPAATPAGSFYVLAQADAASEVVETSEANNVGAVLVRVGPDLTVSNAVATPAISGAGAAVTMTDTTKNSGGGAAAPSMTRFYLSSNGTFDAADVLLGSRPVPALDAGAVNAASTPLTIPVDTIAGSWFLIAVADGEAAVPETTETNNARAVTLRVGPDLRTTGVTAPASSPVDATLVVADTARNDGGGPAGPTTTRYYLSLNAVLDATDIVLGSRAVPALAPSAVHAGSAALSVPIDTPPGRYYILAVADDDDLLPEVFENNNTGWVLVTLKAIVFDLSR